MSRRTHIALAVVLGALALPAAARAHVLVIPDQVTAGADARLDVRVANEEDAASTVKVALQIPPGFLSVLAQPLPGWTSKVTTEKLTKPVKTDDGEVTEQVREVVWTGDGKTGRIAPGQFQDFGLAILGPDAAGKTLTFKTIQTYSNGDVVRWIGPPDAEEPAPTVKVVAAAGGEDTMQGDAGSDTTTAPATTTAESSGSSDGDSNGLAIAALIVGAIALLTGGLALVRARRPAA